MNNKQKAYDKWFGNERIYIKHKDGTISLLTIDNEEYPESPRKWSNVCTIASCKGNWNIADENEAYTSEELNNRVGELKFAQNSEDVYWRFVYMYDHGERTISLQPFYDPWDSGICGVIFVTKEKILKECLNLDVDKWKERAYKIMENEIKVYDQYIRGEVYGFRFYDAVIIDCKNKKTGSTWNKLEWERVDSCCGFYGDPLESGLLDQNIDEEDEILDFKNDDEVLEYLLNN